ncbi:hypothetical protein AWH04_13275 [Rhodococcus erythropolis]|nr:hypothetical protein AWH04_13275 [Rhodococcus erythropolis]
MATTNSADWTALVRQELGLIDGKAVRRFGFTALRYAISLSVVGFVLTAGLAMVLLVVVLNLGKGGALMAVSSSNRKHYKLSHGVVHVSGWSVLGKVLLGVHRFAVGK